MKTKHSSKPHSVHEMLDTLTGVRDHARLQAHLLSLDAQKRWESIETALLNVQTKLERSGEDIATGTLNNFREATEAARTLLSELDGTMELATAVRQVMTERPATCSPQDSLNRAVQLLWELDCGSIPVVAVDGNVVGMVTDRDACMAAYTRGQSPASMTVESAMSRVVHSCSPDDSLGHALRVMAEKQVRRLPVVAEGKLVGLLTLADVAVHVRRHQGNRSAAWVAVAQALAAVSEPRRSAARAAAE